MKTIKQVMLAILVLVLTLGCGPKVTTMKNTGKDLNGYKTYAYLPNSNFNIPAGMEENIGEVDKAVLDEMNRNMQRAGYILDRDHPELLVILKSNLNPEGMARYATYPYSSQFPVSPYYKPYYYWGYEAYDDINGYTLDVDTYYEGALEVDIVDRKTRNVVWSGKAKAPIYDIDTSEALADYVNDIFDNYPTIAQN